MNQEKIDIAIPSYWCWGPFGVGDPSKIIDADLSFGVYSNDRSACKAPMPPDKTASFAQTSKDPNPRRIDATC